MGDVGGFVLGFTMVGVLLLFYVASRAVTYPRDGGRAVVCPVSMRALAATSMIAYTLLPPRWITEEDEGQRGRRKKEGRWMCCCISLL